MSDQKPFVPFEGNSIRRALGEVAATGPGYVRLGALKVMASRLGVANYPLAHADPHRDQRLDAVLDEVEAILGEALLSDANLQTANPDAESDPEAGDDGDNQAEQQEDEDDDDEPPKLPSARTSRPSTSSVSSLLRSANKNSTKRTSTRARTASPCSATVAQWAAAKPAPSSKSLLRTPRLRQVESTNRLV